MNWLRSPFARHKKKIIEIPITQRPFTVVRSQSKDYYAVGILPQTKSLGTYHDLHCHRLTRAETAGDRSYDRGVIEQALRLTTDEDDRRLWTRILFGTQTESGITVTHRLSIRYILPSGGNRALLDWAYDFAVLDTADDANFLAGFVCRSLVGMLQDCGTDALVPSKEARGFWHTAVYRAVRRQVFPEKYK